MSANTNACNKTDVSEDQPTEMPNEHTTQEDREDVFTQTETYTVHKPIQQEISSEISEIILEAGLYLSSVIKLFLRKKISVCRCRYRVKANCFKFTSFLEIYWLKSIGGQIVNR